MIRKPLSADTQEQSATDWDWYWSETGFNRDHWWKKKEHSELKCANAAWYELLRRHPITGVTIQCPRHRDWEALENDPLNFQGKDGFPNAWEIVRSMIKPELPGIDLAAQLSTQAKKTWIELRDYERLLFVEVLSHYSFAKGLTAKARVTRLHLPKTEAGAARFSKFNDVQFVAYTAELAAKSGKLVFVVDPETNDVESVIAEFGALYRSALIRLTSKKQRWESWFETISNYENSEAKRRGQLLSKNQVSKKGENQKARQTFQSLFRCIEF